MTGRGDVGPASVDRGDDDFRRPFGRLGGFLHGRFAGFRDRGTGEKQSSGSSREQMTTHFGLHRKLEAEYAALG